MENIDKKECGCGMHQMGGCGCPGCHGGKHHLIKIILKIIIIILIFWCGFKLGDITGSIRGGYGREIGSQMMRGWNSNSNSVVTPSSGTPIPPATK